MAQSQFSQDFARVAALIGSMIRFGPGNRPLRAHDTARLHTASVAGLRGARSAQMTEADALRPVLQKRNLCP
jgi:hypothetical protein